MLFVFLFNRESASNTMPGPMIGPLFTRSLLADHDDKTDWIIKPDQLILHAPTQRKLIMQQLV